MSVYEPLIGGAVISFFVSPLLTWTANTYVGLGPDGPNAVKTSVLAWVAPGPGIVNNLVVQGRTRQTTGGPIHVLLCKNVGSTSPDYPPTVLDATVLNNAGSGSDSEHSFTVARGDMVVAFCSGTWANGQAVSASWTPTGP